MAKTPQIMGWSGPLLVSPTIPTTPDKTADQKAKRHRNTRHGVRIEISPISCARPSITDGGHLRLIAAGVVVFVIPVERLGTLCVLEVVCLGAPSAPWVLRFAPPRSYDLSDRTRR